MTLRNRILIPALAAAVSATAGLSTAAAEFNFVVSGYDPGDIPVGDPHNGFPSFEGRWGITAYWEIVPGTGADDGTAGIPDGLDIAIINRTANPVNQTKAVLDGGGYPTPLSVAKIIGTGAGNGTGITDSRQIDVQIKVSDLLLGDLELLASPDPFVIANERDRDLIIDGVISGPGDLALTRAGGFSPGGVTSDEIISITGTAPNTLTGNVTLQNVSNGSQPSFWVADKEGAFGQAPTLSLSVNGTGGGTNIAQLAITANANSGEGAIDDDVTVVSLGLNAVLDVAAGVDEVIGSGNLLIDLFGTGSFTTVPDGTYDNTEAWITGDGTITVGAAGPALPGDTDGDGDIDDADLGTSFANYTGPLAPGTGGKTAAEGDTDGDGDVDDADLGTSFSGYTGPLAAAVPEPTSLALLGLGGLLVARRRRG